MTEASSPPPPHPARATRRLRLPKLLSSPVAIIGGGIVLFWCLVALFAPVLAPYSPVAQYTAFQPIWSTGPDGQFFMFGTDHLGRDLASRVIWGARRVLLYSVVATAAAYVVGVTMGLVAGYLRGWIDDVISTVANIVLSFPVLVLYVVLISVYGASVLNIVLAITFASAPGIMRIVRGVVFDLRNRDYVASAQTRGESAFYIMFFEILPNATSLLIVDACLRLGYVTITIGVLGFLGLGLPPPEPDWGGMVNENRSMAAFAPHLTLIPCLAISSLVLGLNLLADGLRETELKD